MHQTDEIRDLAKELNIDEGGSSNEADRLRKIASSIGMNDYNSIYDNDELEKRLKELKRNKELNDSSLASRNSSGTNSNFNNNQNASKLPSDNIGKTGHPSRSMADKLAGSAMDLSGLKGKIAKKALNKMNEKGALDNGAKVNYNKNKPTTPSIGPAKAKRGPFGKGFLPFGPNDDKLNTKDKLEQNNQNQGIVNVQVPKGLIIKLTIILIPIFMAVVFAVLMISASQSFVAANGMDQANKSKDDNIDISDDGHEDKDISDDDVSFVDDIYINDANKKIKKYEFASKKYEELTLTKDLINSLKDFYPDIVNYTGDEYNQNDVYKFFIKLQNIYNYYLGIGVKLDMPLLMSVLCLQSSDMSVVFKANIVDYDNNAIELGTKNPDFDVKKDWSNYKSTENVSTHDMEVLAQGMVMQGSSSTSSGDDDGSTQPHEISSTGKEVIDRLNEIALKQASEVNAGGKKYWSWYGFNYRDEWCAMFVSWLFNQVDGLDKYIKADATAGGIVRGSTQAGYGVWYEDECTNSSTVPQAGDVIVFDPYINGTYMPYPKHGNDKFYSSHVGYVYKVDNTYVYTVEGNSGDIVRMKQYDRKTHCNTVGIQGINGYFRPNY